MRKIYNTLKMDISRAILTFRFICICLIVTIFLFIGSFSEFKFAKDVLYLYKYSMEISGLGFLTPLLSSLPYSSGFLDDYENKYFRNILIRSSIKDYTWSKIITCSLSGGLSLLIGIGSFLLILSFKYPLVSQDSQNYKYFAEKTVGGTFLTGDNPEIYFLICLFLIFLSGVFWSSVALAISSVITNRFVTYSIPFVLSYFSNVILKIISPSLQLNRIADGLVIIKNTFCSLIYALCMYLILTFIVSSVTKANIIRRLKND